MAVALVHTPPLAPPAPSVLELVVQTDPLVVRTDPAPAALDPLPEAQVAVATEAETAPGPQPETPAGHTTDQPQALEAPEPAEAQPAAPAEQVQTSAEQPAQPPASDATVMIAPVSPPLSLPTAVLQSSPIVAHRAITPLNSAVTRSRLLATMAHPLSTSVPVAGRSSTREDTVAAPNLAVSDHTADQEAGFEARVREAVQGAVHYPAAARMMGVTGRARLRLDYRNGAVDDPRLAQSSGMAMLDQAALAAAHAAHYPATPPALAGRLLRFLVWVEFRAG